MIIESITIKNFRSIQDETLPCEPITVLVGPNGAGKSSFLCALELFYSPSPKVDATDFYASDTSQELIVAVTFTDLSAAAKDRFKAYLQADKLTVERVFKWNDGKPSWNHHGSRLQNADFEPVYSAGSAKDKQAAYNTLKNNTAYSTLPVWKNQKDAETALKQWEEANPGQCVRQRDDGQFFGFKQVGQGYLGDFTRFLFIPAVRDASDDATEGKGSVITGLMDLVVRSVLANKEEVKKLREETQQRYKDILDPAKLSELSDLEKRITDTLRTFVPDAAVKMAWQPLSEVSIPMPQADTKLEEDGYSSPVGRAGHGLQRAFLLTVLQHLVYAQVPQAKQSEETTTTTPPVPNLILAIEEPELYQHPSRQRHLAQTLLKLASGAIPGVAQRTQIVYGTHSPLFVGIDRIDQIRLLRKQTVAKDRPKVTKIVRASCDQIAEDVWKADGSPTTKYTGATLLPRLQSIMTPWMSEGFFADVAVLVEGEDDRAAILGIAKSKDHELESKGFAVIPCGGKTSMDRPAAIFKSLGIPIYLIWDGDEGGKDAKPADNHRLLRLLGETVEDWPSGVTTARACFKKNLEETLRSEIGEADFDKWLANCQTQFGIPKKEHAMKNPFVIKTIIESARTANKTSPTLEAIVERLLAIRNPQPAQ